MTKPTSIDEFLQEYVDKFVAPTIPGTLGAAFAGQVQGWLKVKLTTLVEQARQELEQEVCKRWGVLKTMTEGEMITENMEQSLFAFDTFVQSLAARTISSDKK